MARLARVLPHGVMLVVACLLYWAATRIDADTGGRIGPDVWPKAVIAFMALLCVYEIVKRLVVRTEFEATGVVAMAIPPASSDLIDPPPAPSQGRGNSPPSPLGEGRGEGQENYRMLFGGIAVIGGYVVAVPWIGFFTATALFLATFPWVGGLRRPAVSLALSLAGTLLLALVFLKVAYISLPLGEGPFRSLSLALLRLIGVS
jgi:putative tricarboxylic transport membrane protein